MHATPILLLLLVSSVLAAFDTQRDEKLQNVFKTLDIQTTGDNSCTNSALSLDLLDFMQWINTKQFSELQRMAIDNHWSSFPTYFPRTTPSSSLNPTLLQGRNYFFSKNQKATWLDARQFCRTFGMDLASLETKEEHELIKGHLEQIGLTPQYVSISGNKLVNDTYHWGNGVKVERDFGWAPNQPAYGAARNCMIIWNRGWYDLPCEDHLAHFICEQTQ